MIINQPKIPSILNTNNENNPTNLFERLEIEKMETKKISMNAKNFDEFIKRVNEELRDDLLIIREKDELKLVETLHRITITESDDDNE